MKTVMPRLGALFVIGTAAASCNPPQDPSTSNGGPTADAGSSGSSGSSDMASATTSAGDSATGSDTHAQTTGDTATTTDSTTTGGTDVTCPLSPNVADQDYAGTNDPGAATLFDVYLPSGSPPAAGWPTLLYFVGGGFTTSSKDIEVCPGEGIPGLALERQLALVVAQYPVAPAIFPEPEMAASMAVQWIRYRAAAWNLDPDHIIAAGRSASGIVAQWTALNDDRADPKGSPWAQMSSHVHAVVNIAGATDFTVFGAVPGTHFGANYGPQNPPPEEVLLAASSMSYAFLPSNVGHTARVPVLNRFADGSIGSPPISNKHDPYFGQVLNDALMALDGEFHGPHSAFLQVQASVAADEATVEWIAARAAEPAYTAREP